MEWTDEGVILGVRRHGEAAVIVEAMTRAHGRHLGLVRNGRTTRMRAVLQPGNSVDLTWRARLAEHLGHFAIEPSQLRVATLMQSAIGLLGLQVIAGHLRLLPERDPHVSLYRAALVMLDHLDEPKKAAHLLIRFELALLEELGFGLDLEKCAATGTVDDLAYVSPKTGRAISGTAGSPWAGKLLPLPAFLTGRDDSFLASGAQMRQALELTGYFLDKEIWTPRKLNTPDERRRLIEALLDARINMSTSSSGGRT